MIVITTTIIMMIHVMETTIIMIISLPVMQNVEQTNRLDYNKTIISFVLISPDWITVRPAAAPPTPPPPRCLGLSW